jgi:hypothetical protein
VGGGDGDGDGDGDIEWAFSGSKRVHTNLEGKSEDTFRVRKRRPYIHASRIEGNCDQVESIVKDEGGKERKRSREYEGLREATQAQAEVTSANTSESKPKLSRKGMVRKRSRSRTSIKEDENL